MSDQPQDQLSVLKLLTGRFDAAPGPVGDESVGARSLAGTGVVNDTSPDVAARLDALMAERSGSDRVRMACEMFDLARALAVAGIRTADPGISDAALRVKLFERFYWDDFSPEERDRIVASLR